MPGLPANSPAWIGLAVTATAAQRDAARKAALSPTARAAGSVTITADGAQPTTDLPVTVYYVKKAPEGGAELLTSIINMFPGGSTLQIPLDAPTALTATAGNAQVSLTWTDPNDKYATPEGETAQDPDQLVSVWSHTVLVRKTGSQPAGPNDGTVVISSSVRNQYQSAPYVDTGLTNDTTYYYGVFAYNEDGVASPGAFTNATPVAGTPLSQLAEGTLIKILENGSPVEFYLAKHNYESGLNGAGRELVVRKDCYDSRVWNKVNKYTYASSSLDSWFNSTYKNMLDADIRSLVGTAKIRYTPDSGDNTVDTLERAVFALSATELGQSSGNFNVEGAALPIADTLKVAHLYGSVNDQWTRSPRSNSGGVIFLTSDGNASSSTASIMRGSRPAFILPSALLVDENLNIMPGSVSA